MEKWKKLFYVGKTSRRFILSFLSVLILPMICFIVLFQHSFRDIYRGKVVEQAQSNLDVIGKDFDRKIESLRTLVEYNSIDKDYKTIVDTLLKEWKGNGADAFKSDSEKVKKNLVGIHDVLKSAFDILVDCREVIKECDTSLGEYNENPDK